MSYYKSVVLGSMSPTTTNSNSEFFLPLTESWSSKHFGIPTPTPQVNFRPIFRVYFWKLKSNENRSCALDLQDIVEGLGYNPPH